MASNKHGNNNEIEMVNYLNGKTFKELNLTMKEFIKYICITKNLSFNDNTIIEASYETNNKLKQDIYVKINGITVGVSLKMGSGNSCHQEKIEDFIQFITERLNATNEICNLWRFFIWADGTLDGTGSMDKNDNGKIISRFDARGFKKIYPEKREKLQEFLNDNKAALLERAIFVGKYNSNVEFVYHGTYRQGRWISKNEVIDYQLNYAKSSKTACLTLGSLTVQAWNVSLEGNTEKKRGEIQLKYGAMQKDFDILMKESAETIGTFLGDMEEYGLTHTLNKNKQNPMWKTILPNVADYSDYYLVKVSSNQPSALSGKKVKTKSDAYVIKATLDREFLLSKEYVIDENDIRECHYEIQNGTGVSIKMKSSNSYTYQKFTRNSFCKAFEFIDNIEFWLVSLLIYSSEKERYKNSKIISDFDYTMESYLNKVSEYMDIDTTNTDSQSFWDSVRRHAQAKIKHAICSNTQLSESIFTGKHWFEEPYIANFIYKDGNLSNNSVADFSITTGSGRSKGKYNIEIIPQ